MSNENTRLEAIFYQKMDTFNGKVERVAVSFARLADSFDRISFAVERAADDLRRLVRVKEDAAAPARKDLHAFAAASPRQLQCKTCLLPEEDPIHDVKRPL